MSFYSEIADLVAEVLVEEQDGGYGAEVTIRRTTGRVVDDVTGAVTTAGTVQDLTTHGILKPYPDNMIDGTRILASDRELVLDPTVEPLPTDKMLVQGEYWSVQRIKAVNPAGTPLVYKVQVRK